MNIVTDFVIGVPTKTVIWYWCGTKDKRTVFGWSKNLWQAKIYKSYTSAGQVITRYQNKDTNNFWKDAKYQTIDEWKAEDPLI